MTMIERAARAIFPIDNPSPEEWERHKAVARAAIDAMREPTNLVLREMLNEYSRPRKILRDVQRNDRRGTEGEAMTMIEKVKQVLREKLIRPGYLLTEKDFEDIARASIEAMRELSKSVVNEKPIIERIARTLAHNYEGGEDHWHRCHSVAEVILQTMREPTEEMLEAGRAYEFSGSAHQVRIIWQAMIDAALKEKS